MQGIYKYKTDDEGVMMLGNSSASFFAILVAMTKKLYRSSKNKVIGGVCGGMADYFSIDPVITRLACILITFATHLLGGVLVYIIAWIILPLDTEVPEMVVKISETKKDEAVGHANKSV